MQSSMYSTLSQSQSLPNLHATGSSSKFGGGKGKRGSRHSVNIFPFETLQVLKNASAVGKINMSVTRNDFYRRPRLLSKNQDTCLEKIFELTLRMKFKFFQRFSGYQIKELIKVMDIVYKPAGEYLFHRGDMGENMYLIYMGQVDVIVGDDDEAVFTLGPGQSFGELALQLQNTRTSSVRCHTECGFGVLSRRVFTLATHHERMLDDSRVTALIKKVSPFSALRSSLIIAMAQQMDPLRLSAGDEIPTEEFEELFFMPISGVFEIRGTVILGARTLMLLGGTADRGDAVYKNIPLFTLSKGQYFNDDIFMPNEDSYSKKVGRDWGQGMLFQDFYCVSRGDGQLLTMARHIFEKFLRMDRSFVTRLQLRRSMLNMQIKDQMQQVVRQLSMPDYFTKSSLYTKKILAIIETASNSIAMDKVLKNFDEQILLDSRAKEAQQAKKVQVMKKFDEAEKQAREEVSRNVARTLATGRSGFG